MESGYTYPERSGHIAAEADAYAEAQTGIRTNNNARLCSEVSRGHSKPETSRPPAKGQGRRSHQKLKDRMLEGRRVQDVYGKSTDNRNASERYLCEDRPEAESRSQKELSCAMQPMKPNAGKEVFF